MPGKLFSIGQEVTPVVRNWDLIDGIQMGPLPVFGEIYTVIEYRDETKIVLKELHPGDSYEQEGFAPVLPAESIDQLMQESHEKEWTQQQYY